MTSQSFQNFVYKMINEMFDPIRNCDTSEIKSYLIVFWLVLW